MAGAVEQTLLICSRCHGSRAARQLKSALSQQVASGTRFRAVDCLAGCDFPPAVALQAPDKASYLFGGIGSAEEISALAAFSHQYADSDSGWTSNSERPAALDGKALARLPALPRASSYVNQEEGAV
ncbi:DUF1636 family protein [Phaeobacter sp.]|uniref:DUF1636 family protein n=1 Tax=Phaeobacter sp. TaxID=1902409 RepID=UPI0025F99F9B|nr:DUF1636 family protein [Phaeobacter sp.]